MRRAEQGRGRSADLLGYVMEISSRDACVLAALLYRLSRDAKIVRDRFIGIPTQAISQGGVVPVDSFARHASKPPGPGKASVASGVLWAMTTDLRNYMMSVVRRYVRDAQDVEDVTQEACLRAHKYRDSYRGDSAYKSWLYRVAATASLDFLRGRRRAVDTEEVPEHTAGPQNTRARAIARVELARVEVIVEDLGPRLDAVFWQSVRDGMTEGEIAKAHGLTVPAVKARIHRAKKAVAAAFAEAA
jgi:RNA polymerase sigma-70 factor (ECF subfamily)